MRKSHLALPLLFLLPVACGDDDGGPGPGGGERRLVILHTNDEHSHLFGFAPEVDDFPPPTAPGTGAIQGGIARRAKVLKAERMAAFSSGVETLTVSAGDETQGALPQVAFKTGAPDFTLMKQLGYDVMCPGNHEFDLGPAAYAAAIGAAMGKGGLPQIVSTNIHFSSTSAEDDTLAALYGEGDSDKPIKRYHIVTTNSGLRVGFFGVMGVQASYYAPLKVPVTFSVPSGENGYTGIEKIYPDIQPTVDKLRNDEKVDVVVMVSHGGVSTQQPEVGDDYQIAQHVSGIDVIISGHSHTALTAPQVVTDPDGHEVPIVQAGSYGGYVGRIELIVKPGERPTWDKDPSKTKLITIDDTIVPDDEVLLGQLEGIIKQLEAGPLVELWTRILGTAPTDDPAVVGDLYFKSVGQTDFDVIGLRASQETNMLNLSTDAMLKTARALGKTTALAVNAAGSVRGDIIKGKTGEMTIADLYRVFPLGMNPVDGSIGYPLCHFYIWKVEIKGAFEVAVSQGLIADSVFMSPSGLKVEFDTSRPAADLTPTALLDPQNGRVTKMTLDTTDDNVDNYDTVIFDLSATDPWINGDPTQLFPVATSLYVASFAGSAGVTLKNAAGDSVALTDTILKRPDGSVVKELEAFVAYIKDIAAANGGKLPTRYDETQAAGTLPRRMICSGPLCP
jgi:5'-nucleotidase / UDP-sugar diphosphatase